MKSLNLNFYLSIIIISLFFLSIKAQNITQSEVNQLFNNNLIKCNKTEMLFREFSEKMKNIKYNIILKIKYKNLQKKHNKIEKKIGKIKELLNSNNYNKNEILEDIRELNKSLTKFEYKCNKAIHAFYKGEKVKTILNNLLKVFFITLFITIFLLLIVIVIISIFIIKRQKNYYALDEESSKVDIIKEEGRNNISESIKIKNKKTNEDSSERKMKKKKKDKKKNNHIKEETD